ncbi:repressor LexA [Hespellia stercorisuis DSM 15480]|uniref:Repressor LexA n=2 Tax=Hespellia stercorisuis TaxID=180311 RepID=A0A1M6VGJ5_9FIRM|nr:repressor LexA [Hespellia stercorisuis DSM 15480]
MTLGDIVKRYRADNEISMDEFSKRCSLSKGYISMLENNINPRNNKPIAPTLPSIKKIANGMNTDVDTLLKMLDNNQEINLKEEQLITNIYPIELKRFPLLGEIACGVPKFANEDRESYVMAGTDIDADFCLKAKGDSMVNARIQDGDIVFIKQQDIVENGEIAAVVVNNDSEATLKRFYYYKEKAMMILRAENPQYEDQIYTEEELNQVHILGKAVAFQSDVI